ncbi:unnamed protein product [Mytilus coruscus]|uniref:Uncharacterized protein n=1 Tax=Mytilus coruscus TaxID=42192 RepID=A0A6J8BNF6_MYTCO|nr:unnamed protein product [Mytilus coruscus]
MATGQCVLVWTLLDFGLLVRLKPPKSDILTDNRCKPEDLGYYAYTNLSFLTKWDLILKNFCPDPVVEHKMADNKKAIQATKATNIFLQCGFALLILMSELKLMNLFPMPSFVSIILQRGVLIEIGGGLIAYAGSDLAADRKIQLEFSDVESIGIEVAIGTKKWFFCGIYKSPSMSTDHFKTDFTKTIDKI